MVKINWSRNGVNNDNRKGAFIMIDDLLFDYVAGQLPTINTEVIAGITSIQTQYMDTYLDDVWKCAEESFPPGLKYISGKRCLPEEVFKEMVRKTPKSFELLPSDVYLVKYHLSYNGQALKPQYLYLPYVGEAGLLTLNGTLYQLTPVLGGKIFNVERGNIYMHIPRQRLRFKPFPVSFFKDDQIVNERAIYSPLHNKKTANQKSSLRASLVHYLLCNYGLQELLKVQYNVNALITKEDNIRLDKYVVFRSKEVNKKLLICIPKEEYYKQLDSIIGAVFYITDAFPEATDKIEDLNDKSLWIHLLDRFIFKGNTDINRYSKMLEHLASVEKYFDSMTRKQLNNNGILVNSIYDVFRYITINYNDLDIHYGNGTMYHKELSTVKYLMYNVVYSIFSAMYAICLLPDELLSVKKIEDVFRKNLNPNKIFNTYGHGELTALSTGIASDCTLYGATGRIISHSQATAMGGKRSRSSNVHDSLTVLHPSQIAVSSYLWITSSNPVGRGNLNPFSTFSQGWVTSPNPRFEKLVNNLTTLLEKRTETYTEETGEQL
jgi:hypothetical protein